MSVSGFRLVGDYLIMRRDLGKQVVCRSIKQIALTTDYSPQYKRPTRSHDLAARNLCKKHAYTHAKTPQKPLTERYEHHTALFVTLVIEPKGITIKGSYEVPGISNNPGIPFKSGACEGYRHTLGVMSSPKSPISRIGTDMGTRIIIIIINNINITVIVIVVIIIIAITMVIFEVAVVDKMTVMKQGPGLRLALFQVVDRLVRLGKASAGPEVLADGP